MEVGRTATVGRICSQGMIPAMTILLLILLVLAVVRFVLLRPIRTRPVDSGLAHTVRRGDVDSAPDRWLTA